VDKLTTYFSDFQKKETFSWTNHEKAIYPSFLFLKRKLNPTNNNNAKTVLKIA
jgi:hypothetical protein